MTERKTPNTRAGAIVAGVTAGLIGASLATAAAAHEFTAALMVHGPDREARLAEAVNGFLLAADERDGHAAETSDGHLGGVDVQILPLPRDATGGVTGLVGSPSDQPDVFVIFGTGESAPNPPSGFSSHAILMVPGTLPEAAEWRDTSDADGFAARYQNEFGQAPTEYAAMGYNAARRLELAIRPQDGFVNIDEIASAIAETAGGITW